MQMTTMTNVGGDTEIALFTPQSDTAVIAEDFSRVLEPGHGGQGWLARRGLISLGYLGDEAKTARTFPTIDGVRWSVPGDRAIMLSDGRIELLGRDSITINSGGEKIFAEEVERAIAAHPGVLSLGQGGHRDRRMTIVRPNQLMTVVEWDRDQALPLRSPTPNLPSSTASSSTPRCPCQ